MKKKYLLLILCVVSIKLSSQTIWTGTKTTFTKSSGADWNLEANQDRITSNVWITRGATQGIFNIFSESSYQGASSPQNTEWSYGTTADIGSLNFQSWVLVHGSNPPSSVGQDMVLHIISDDIYIDIKFLSWGTGSGGGGSFSYERSTDQSLSTVDNSISSNIELYPNPVEEKLNIIGINDNENYSIYDVLGQHILSGKINSTEGINTTTLNSGIYFLKFEDGSTKKFVKS